MKKNPTEALRLLKEMAKDSKNLPKDVQEKLKAAIAAVQDLKNTTSHADWIRR